MSRVKAYVPTYDDIVQHRITALNYARWAGGAEAKAGLAFDETRFINADAQSNYKDGYDAAVKK